MLLNLKNKLQYWGSKFYVQCAVVFLATTVSDFIWAKYMGNVSTGNSIVAANWAVLVIALGAYLVVSYVHDKRLVLPAAVGAWIGTYLAV